MSGGFTSPYSMYNSDENKRQGEDNMTTGIFATWAKKYWEMGYNPIPIRAGYKKKPPPGFERWATERLPEEEIDAWVEAFPNYNIAIACGPISGTVIDIDIDDPALIALAPIAECNMIRRNVKGLALHFKYIDHPNQNLGAYDFLGIGKYCLMPPSYIIDTDSTYQFSHATELIAANDLNTLDTTRLNKWFIDSAPFIKTRTNTGRKTFTAQKPGRNNTLSEMALAKARDIREIGLDREQAISEMIAFDERHHTPPWLTDPTEADEHRNDPRGFLKKMLAKKEKWLEKNSPDTDPEDIQILEPTEEELGEFTERNQLIAQQAGVISRMLPKNGLIDMFNSECEKRTNLRSPVINFAGSLSLCAVLAANKLRFQDSHSNCYVFNLAPSGAGKNTPQVLIQEILLQADNGAKLLGSSSYASAQAFVGALARKREKIDLIDEITGMLRKMRDATGNSPYVGMADAMMKAYSASHATMLEGSAQTQQAKTQLIHNPCVSILGSGVTNVFFPTLTGEYIRQGFLARCFTLLSPMPEPIGEEKTPLPYGWGKKTDIGPLPADLMKIVDKWTSRPVVQKMHIVSASEGNFAVETQRLIVDEAKLGKLVRDLNAEFMKEHKRAEAAGFLSAPSFYRAFEQVNRLIICYCISQDTFEVTADIIRWAYDIWNAQFNSIRAELETESFASDKVDFNSAMRKLKQFIKAEQRNSNGKDILSFEFRALGKKSFLRNMKVGEQRAFLKSLEDIGAIKFNKGRPGMKGDRTNVEFYLSEFDLD